MLYFLLGEPCSCRCFCQVKMIEKKQGRSHLLPLNATLSFYRSDCFWRIQPWTVSPLWPNILVSLLICLPIHSCESTPLWWGGGWCHACFFLWWYCEGRCVTSPRWQWYSVVCVCPPAVKCVRSCRLTSRQEAKVNVELFFKCLTWSYVMQAISYVTKAPNLTQFCCLNPMPSAPVSSICVSATNN